jgi:CheY-like chemotaxis protein/HPt (histidine-containing phosphotransfer) domain-containing protein
MANANTAKDSRKKLRILVADDNAINQKVIQKILQGAGHRVDMVENGLQAVKFASQTQYDLILMDIQMPLLDGYEATSRIRDWEDSRRDGTAENSDSNATFDLSNSEFKRVPIVAMTGNSLEMEIKKLQNLKMNGYIGKPLFRDQVLSMLKKWMHAEPGSPASGQVQKDDSQSELRKSGADQPINFDRALNEFMGENEVLYSLLKEFTEKVRSQISAIQQAILSQDYKSVANQAHSIKGGAGNLTAEKVADVASDLENAAVRQQGELTRHLVDLLEEKIQQLETFLKDKFFSVHGAGK